MLYTHKEVWLSDHLLMRCLHGNKMALIIDQPDHRRGVSVCCIFHCGNKFESFPPADTHCIKMIHSQRVWSESCSSLHFYPVHVCITPANALNNCSEIHPHILIKAQISLWLTEPPILKLISGWMDDDDVDGAVLRGRGILKLSIVPSGLYQWLYIKPRKYNLLYLILCRPFSKHDCK